MFVRINNYLLTGNIHKKEKLKYFQHKHCNSINFILLDH
jgi:hypothetical protein